MIKSDYNAVEIGDRLYDLRKEKGLSQESAAEELDISRDSLSKYERGKHLINGEVLSKMSKLYGASIEYILHGDSIEETILPEIMLTFVKYNKEQQKHLLAALVHLEQVLAS